jgi:hypothetical protein
MRTARNPSNRRITARENAAVGIVAKRAAMPMLASERLFLAMLDADADASACELHVPERLDNAALEAQCALAVASVTIGALLGIVLASVSGAPGAGFWLYCHTRYAE